LSIISVRKSTLPEPEIKKKTAASKKLLTQLHGNIQTLHVLAHVVHAEAASTEMVANALRFLQNQSLLKPNGGAGATLSSELYTRDAAGLHKFVNALAVLRPPETGACTLEQVATIISASSSKL